MVKEYELESLPEKSQYTEQEECGVIVMGFREVGVSRLEDDDVIVFTENGRRMFIGHDSEGAYKYPA